MDNREDRALSLLEKGDFYDTIEELVRDETPTPWRAMEPFQRLWGRAMERASFFPASTRYHGVWVGGLNDHMNDILVYMWLMRDLYDKSLSAAQLGVLALLHDWEKLWKYKLKPVKSADGSTIYYESDSWEYSKARPTVSHALRIGAFLHWSKSSVNDHILNALTMSEGGWSVESRAGNHTESLPVAALLHAADMFSAKVRGKSMSRWAKNQLDALSKKHPQYTGLLKVQTEVEVQSPIEKVLWPD
jgi:hypothetical protein